MKKIFSIFTLLFLSNIFGQNIEKNGLSIVYKKIIVNENQLDEPKPYFYQLNINISKNISVYDIIENNTVTSNDNNTESRTIEFKPKGKNLNTVYKDYNANQLHSKGMIGLKFLTIKDSLSIFNWKIENKTKKILGYNCQLATTNFRGRSYEAWFTSDLAQGGPWKFDGLPGLILDIRSIDNYIHFTAESISTNSEMENSIYENPFLEEKALSWDEFKKTYKDKAIALSKYKFADNDGVGIYTPRIGIERYIEENDPDYTLKVNFQN